MVDPSPFASCGSLDFVSPTRQCGPPVVTIDQDTPFPQNLRKQKRRGVGVGTLHQLNSATDPVGQPTCQQQLVGWRAKFHEDVDVTLGMRIAARVRTKQDGKRDAWLSSEQPTQRREK